MLLSLLSIPFRTAIGFLLPVNNNLSALRHPDFVVHAILELLDNGCIAEHSEPPFCANPLTVAEGKKLRFK